MSPRSHAGTCRSGFKRRDAAVPARLPSLHGDCDQSRLIRRASHVASNHGPAPSPIALQPDEGEALWFMDFLATIKASAEETGGRVAVIHHSRPRRTQAHRCMCITARANGSMSSTAS